MNEVMTTVTPLGAVLLFSGVTCAILFWWWWRAVPTAPNCPSCDGSQAELLGKVQGTNMKTMKPTNTYSWKCPCGRKWYE